MKVSLNWLTDYVDISMPASELADMLTMIGLNCEEVIETPTDIVLDVEVTSNRPDCLGHLGVAREIAAATGVEFRPPAVEMPSTSGSVADMAAVEVHAPDICPRYTARVIRSVEVRPSPAWMLERLEAVGLRGINNIVDATNYVLMEYSQPLHSFDYDKLADHRIIVRRGLGGEEMVSIDETTCRLDESMLVIADAEKAVAIAGVMGGLGTEVTQSTTNVLIESAQFDRMATRLTSRKLALMSESNCRFERGVDPVGIDEASLRACLLILELGGGELADGMVDVWAEPFQPSTVSMRPQRCSDLLGVDIAVERQVEILARLGLSPVPQDERIVCTVPSYRADLIREADLIEEVARMEGYESIPVVGKITHAVTDEGEVQRLRRRVGDALTAAGFDEAITYTFVDAEEAQLFGCESCVCVDATVRRTNNALRPTLLPSLLRACKTNQDAGNDDVRLFELAGVFPKGSGAMPRESVELAMVATGELRDLRGAVESLVRQISPGAVVDVCPADVPGMARQAAAEIRFAAEPVGVIGCIAPEVAGHYGLERRVAAATLRFDALLATSGVQRTYTPVPKFPSVRRDLSLIVQESVNWAELQEAILAIDQPLRVAIEYVTTYRGRPIPDGQKSITVTLVYRSDEATLRSEDVDEQVQQIIAALKERLSAELRS